MQRIRVVSLALLLPALAVFLASGCGGGDTKGTDKPKADGGKAGGDGGKKDGTASKASAGKEELASTGWGTIKGKVVFDGEPPVATPLVMNKDTDHCKKGPKTDTMNPTWVVGADKGVGNVVVWLQAPKDKYFQIPDAQKERKDTVTIQQPFCAFEPHVFVLYPSYFDGKSKLQKATGQTCKVTNTAPIAHNTNLTFSDAILNVGENKLLKPNTAGSPVDEISINAKACKDKDTGKVEDVKISCNVHPWMSCYGKVFDHPFVAVTTGGKEGDKTFGEFVIPNAPAGAEVDLMYWHESMSRPAVAQKVTLKDKGETTAEIKIKK